jgi:hypothetical protein
MPGWVDRRLFSVKELYVHVNQRNKRKLLFWVQSVGLQGGFINETTLPLIESSSPVEDGIIPLIPD